MLQDKSCDICGAEAPAYSISVNGFNIHKCSNCGLEFTLPRPTDYELNVFYSNYVNIRANSEVVTRNAKKIIMHLRENFNMNESSKVLDFGCGNGEFVTECGKNCYGIELGVKNSERIKNNLKDLPVKSFDFIVMFDVLEHLNKIYETMDSLCSLLKENGYIVIITVDAESKIPYHYKPPEHLTYWTKKSFEIFANRINTNIVEYSDYEMFQLSSIYLNRLLSRTPETLSTVINQNCDGKLPLFVKVPTNEVFAVLQKRV